MKPSLPGHAQKLSFLGVINLSLIHIWATEKANGNRISVAVTDSLYDLNMVFVKSQIDINDKVFRTIKGRTQFISCAYH